MTTDTISRWLQSPDNLPDEAAVQTMVASSPWFVPARLMEAAQQHRRQPYSPASLSLIRLYGPDWVSAYGLLTAAGKGPIEALSGAVPAGLTGDAPASAPAAPSIPATEPEAEVPPAATPEAAPAAEAEAAEKTAPAAEAAPAARPEEPAVINAETVIQPPFVEDYFRDQNITAPAEEVRPGAEPAAPEDPKTLMVVMSFAEWLSHFKLKSAREEEEAHDKRALRSMWQQEKLAAALEDEPEEIPEDVFEMAVSSITREDDLASESLAEILEKQGKWGAAADMYRKLGLRNPTKSSYFATRAEAAKNRSL